MSLNQVRVGRLCLQVARRLPSGSCATWTSVLESRSHIYSGILSHSSEIHRPCLSNGISLQFTRTILSRTDVLEKQPSQSTTRAEGEGLSLDNMPLHPNPFETHRAAASPSPNDAEEETCDKKLAELREAKEKAAIAKERAERLKAAQVPSLQTEALNMIRNALYSTVGALRAVGPYLLSCLRMSPAEWKKALSGGWQHFWHEMKHYWVGTKLLAVEVKIASKRLYKVAQGKTLSRRERKQLLRTSSDLLRVVPLAMIVFIPFLELFLPLILRLFPNILPSTFQDKHKREEELRRKVSAKMEVAKFLQDAVEEWAAKAKGKAKGKRKGASELHAFMRKVRAGEPVHNEDIVAFATLFKNELTLENISRTELVSMCKLMRLNTFGTDAFLRYQLRASLRKLAEDDRMIQHEGVQTLSHEELVGACRVRGMRWDGETGAAMRQHLEEWLDLSLNHKLPSSLLILSRAFTITHSRSEDPHQASLADLQSTLSALPDEVLEEVEMTELREDNSMESKQRKLEYLAHQEDMCKEEEEEEAAKKRELLEEKLEEAKAQTKAQAEAQEALSSKDVALEEMVAAGAAGEKAVAAGASAAPAASEPAPEAAEDESSSDDELWEFSNREMVCERAAQRRKAMKALAEALAAMSTPSIVADKRLELVSMLKKEAALYGQEEAEAKEEERAEEAKLRNERLERLNQLARIQVRRAVAAEEGPAEEEAPAPESDSEDEELEEDCAYLRNKVDGLLAALSQELDQVDSEVMGKLRILDQDLDGKLTLEEVQQVSEVMTDELRETDVIGLLEGSGLVDADGKILVADIIQLAAEDTDSDEDDGVPFTAEDGAEEEDDHAAQEDELDQRTAENATSGGQVTGPAVPKGRRGFSSKAGGRAP